MDAVLMHKEIPVVDIEVDKESGVIFGINTVHNSEHLPIGIPEQNGVIDRAEFNYWWTERSIPASRSGIKDALEELGIASTRALLLRCYGLSLSDQYWVKPKDTNLTWQDINFFDNPFSDDVGDILFGANKHKDVLDLSSPDNTSVGDLKKRWKIIDGKRCLVKGGSNPFRQQPFNEVIAAKISVPLSEQNKANCRSRLMAAVVFVCSMVNIGNKIKSWRTKRGINQKQMAALTGFSLRALQGWERGEVSPSLNAVVALAMAMDVTTDWLLGMNEDHKP